jgi:hypothetical protein
VGGIYHPVDPWGPILAGLAVVNAAKGLQAGAREAVQIEALRAIAGAAQNLEHELGAVVGTGVA